MSDENNQVANASQDHIYFAITPRIVWALARNPYDESLWRAIKDIAGDTGECWLGTEDLATLCAMSVGQVYDSRQHLLSVGLLKGEVRRDPGHQQPVWHLRVPDLWAKNTEWCLAHKSIKDRLAFKRAQQDAIRQARAEKKSLHLMKAAQSKGEPSPGEKAPLPGEKAPPPGEAKNIKEKNQEENLGAQPAPAQPSRRTDAQVKGDMLDGMLHFAAIGADPQVALTARIQEYPPDCQKTLRDLVELFGWPLAAIPTKPARGGKGGEFAQWINEIRDINDVITGHGRAALEAAKLVCANLSISHPAGIRWCLPAEVGKLNHRRQNQPAPVSETTLSKTLRNYQPRA